VTGDRANLIGDATCGFCETRFALLVGAETVDCLHTLVEVVVDASILLLFFCGEVAVLCTRNIKKGFRLFPCTVAEFHLTVNV
jgi:hypothetical protein